MLRGASFPHPIRIFVPLAKGSANQSKVFFMLMGLWAQGDSLDPGSWSARMPSVSKVMECEKIVGSRVKECEKIDGSRVKECEKNVGPWVMECEKIDCP